MSAPNSPIARTDSASTQEFGGETCPTRGTDVILSDGMEERMAKAKADNLAEHADYVAQRKAGETFAVLPHEVSTATYALLEYLSGNKSNRYFDTEMLEDAVYCPDGKARLEYILEACGCEEEWWLTHSDEETARFAAMLDNITTSQSKPKKARKTSANSAEKRHDNRAEKCCCRTWGAGKGAPCSRKIGDEELLMCKQHAQYVRCFNDMVESGECGVIDGDICADPLYVRKDGELLPKWRMGYWGDDVPHRELVTQVRAARGVGNVVGGMGWCGDAQ